MKVKQLYETLKFYLSSGAIEDDMDVVITLSDGSVGPRACVGIKSVNPGMDFEHNQFRIEPQEKLFINILRMESPVGTIKETFGGMSFTACGRCHEKVAKYDKYCRNCGQRLM